MFGNLPKYPQMPLVETATLDDEVSKIDPCGKVPKFPVTSTMRSDAPAQM